jgi:hypothetical protein
MSAGEQIVQAEMAKGAEGGGDMAMGKRTEDLKGLLAGDQVLTLQDAAQEIDLRRWPGGEIGESAFVDLGADADGFAEEDGRGRVAVGDGLDIHGSIVQLNRL